MAADSEVLHFQFEQQGDAVLQKMNLLRQQNLFCDVSIYINDTEFQGHKVIFAACSTFMRDQFLLNQSRQVRITILQSAEVGRKLLLSCYTGALEVKKKELLKYLTAASYLQMVHIVEKCTEALSKYLEIDGCHSSDAELKSGDEVLDKDCEIIEISEDSPENEEYPVKQEDGEGPHPEAQSLESERKDTKNRRMGRAHILKHRAWSQKGRTQSPQKYQQWKSDIRMMKSHSLINSTVESRNTEMSGNHFQAFVGDNPEGTSSGVNGFQSLEDSGSSWRHQCPKCPRGFLHLENYLRHLKMHKLFLCLQCGKTFTQKKNLNRHIRGHMGIRPFQCMVCLKTFTAKSTLQDHLNIHSGDRPYKCHCCDMDFKHKSALKKHLTSVHGRSSSENLGAGNLPVLLRFLLLSVKKGVS
uniref:Zinc finger and BTB domain containing 6 n=1 Tax=Ficedula albicollis TaxID=59894 RepID=A0A803VB53_FICAL